ncbi:MAG: DUF2294 domain-containing protein [Chitinispirillaceae bacterium]|nr:DUF2294 domain-containing protein [Chitinispirillaceae bacterium]
MTRNTHLRTRGQLEAEISEAMIRFEKEHMGRGPLETKTYLIDDMVIVRLKGVLTRAEHALIKSDRSVRARELIKQVRIELIENGRRIIEEMIKSITRRKLRSLHTDISTETGERLIVLTLDKPPEYVK